MIMKLPILDIAGACTIKVQYEVLAEDGSTLCSCTLAVGVEHLAAVEAQTVQASSKQIALSSTAAVERESGLVDIKARMLADKQAGMTGKQLAQKYQKSLSRIWFLLREARLQPKAVSVISDAPWGEAQTSGIATVNDVVAARAEGLTIKQMAERFKVSKSTIDHRLRQWHAGKGLCKDRTQTWSEAIISGTEVEQVAEMYNVHPDVVRRRIYASGTNPSKLRAMGVALGHIKLIDDGGELVLPMKDVETEGVSVNPILAGV